MLKKLSAVVLMLGLLTMTPAISMAQDNEKKEATEHREGKERHPKIRQAIHALQAAKEDLEDASHDFGGHRAEALEAVNNALKQLQEALEADKK
jgi:hypothetical protein